MPVAFNGGSQNPVKQNINGSLSLFADDVASFADSEMLGRQSNECRNQLTVDQMQQAMIYLLQTDSTFVQKLHQAYVQSLRQPKNQGLVNGWHHDAEK